MNDLEQLDYTLENGSPILLLGSGFSLGATNAKGSLVCGKDLAKKLYDEFYIRRRHEIPDEQFMCAQNVKDDLKEICTLLSIENRRPQRNNFLTELFSDCTPASFHHLLNCYNWNKIFTLNIDDVVEKVYDKSDLVVWTGESSGSDSTNKTLLVKLHGCVNSKSQDYIFDDSEYTQFTQSQNCLLREFSDSKVKSDLICIGTEFQEYDLLQIMECYKMSGYKDDKKVFIVSPSIHNSKLLGKIQYDPNYFHIKMEAEKFLTHIKNDIVKKIDCREVLKQDAALFVSDYSNVKSSYVTELYTGGESRYEDFWKEYNFIHPRMLFYLKKIDQTNGNIMFSIYGKAYVGKTCFARGVLFELAKKNYISIEYMIFNEHKVHNLLDYLNTLPNGTKVAVLCENAAYHYDKIQYLLENTPANIDKCVIIAVDTISNYNRKKYSTTYSKSKTISFEITEHIDRPYAENIIDKLKSNSWITNIGKFADRNQDQYKFAIEVNDIIDLLYINSEGVNFEKHLSLVFGVSKNDDSFNYFTILSILSSMGISYVPLRVFKSLFPNDFNNIKFHRFLDTYSDWVSNDNKFLHLRCARLIKSALWNKTGKNALVNEDNLVDIIKNIVLQTVGQINEQTSNEWSELFQKVLHADTLLAERVLSLASAKNLFTCLENECKSISYYWIERGIIEEKGENYEEAHRCFMNAKKIRPNSYQTAHAIAKNNMEKGIYCRKHNSTPNAEAYYEEGLKSMIELVESKEFSKSYNYSVHSLVDLQLKYSQTFDVDLSHEQCLYMANLFNNADEKDEHMFSIAKSLKNYCNRNNYIEIVGIIQEFIHRAEQYKQDIM